MLCMCYSIRFDYSFLPNGTSDDRCETKRCTSLNVDWVESLSDVPATPMQLFNTDNKLCDVKKMGKKK
ncbi:hypothetical protein T05_6958 [Trichinella murrelli]|uniref:Uncharacterized protein n=1 Tax=Trichinella murrelli TaxID=144512 RepID=A0A0V0U2G2_9BILA|nr:hypothetical protein T05_6958 [Trichinella murrelli]